jgi:hypothetical protein
VTTDGLTTTSTENLLVIRDNLLSGLDKVAEHVDAGTLDVAPGPKVNPPRGAGTLTLLLLMRVNEILDTRGVAPKW